MFGRATIRLGIGPHSSVLFFMVELLGNDGFKRNNASKTFGGRDSPGPSGLRACRERSHVDTSDVPARLLYLIVVRLQRRTSGVIAPDACGDALRLGR